MYKIGIIGTENSHALAFAKYMNFPGAGGEYPHPGYRVTGVYGPDIAPSQVLIDEGGAEYIAGDYTELLDKVDAVMVTSRRGSVHHQYAAPFIDKGMPVFVDKPFTVDPALGEDLIARAEKSGAPLYGGSSLKVAYDTLLLRNSVAEMKKAGTFRGGSMNYTVKVDSEYDGFFFYAPHLTEAVLTIFGAGIRSVYAMAKGKSVTAIARYDDYDVSLNYTDDTNESTCVIYGTDRNVVRSIDLSPCYAREVDLFVRMIETKKPPEPYKELVLPVYVMNAVLESYTTGKEVYIKA